MTSSEFLFLVPVCGWNGWGSAADDPRWCSFWFLMHYFQVNNVNAYLWLHLQGRLALKLPGFKSTWLPCLGVDVGEVQMSESTTEEHLRSKALLKIWNELPQDAVKKSITSFRKHVRLHQNWRQTLWTFIFRSCIFQSCIFSHPLYFGEEQFIWMLSKGFPRRRQYQDNAQAYTGRNRPTWLISTITNWFKV